MIPLKDRNPTSRFAFVTLGAHRRLRGHLLLRPTQRPGRARAADSRRAGTADHLDGPWYSATASSCEARPSQPL